MTFLSTKDLSFTYPNSKRSDFALSNINLNVNENSVYGLLGKNGSGKSTILRLLGGHLNPSKGTIVMGGVDVTKTEARNRKISTVFQTLALFPHLTVEANILFAIKHSLNLNPSETKKHLIKISNLFHIKELKEKKPTDLSLGQQQRVAIARSLASGAEVLLLDEPTASLDYLMKDQLISIIKKIQSEEMVKSVIIVSHDREFVLETCNHIALIEKGKLVCEGNKSDLVAEPPSREVSLALGLVSLG